MKSIVVLASTVALIVTVILTVAGCAIDKLSLSMEHGEVSDFSKATVPKPVKSIQPTQ